MLEDRERHTGSTVCKLYNIIYVSKRLLRILGTKSRGSGSIRKLTTAIRTYCFVERSTDKRDGMNNSNAIAERGYTSFVAKCVTKL